VLDLIVHGSSRFACFHAGIFNFNDTTGYATADPLKPPSYHVLCSILIRSTEQDFIAGLDGFVEAVGIKKPLALVVQGYVLSQYGLLWAAQVRRVKGYGVHCMLFLRFLNS